LALGCQTVVERIFEAASHFNIRGSVDEWRPHRDLAAAELEM